MNAPDTFTELLALTREPFPASRKLHVPGQLHPQLRVPMREVALSNGETVTLYDTSGPYSDPSADVDVRRGLAATFAWTLVMSTKSAAAGPLPAWPPLFAC